MKKFSVIIPISLFLFVTLLYAGQGKNQKTHKYWMRGSYTGKGIFGFKHGDGLRLYRNKSKYQGDYRFNIRHGKGIYTHADGGKYDGDWHKGERHGKGIYTSTDGRTYNGDWHKGERHGKGISAHADGVEYKGIYKNNKTTFLTRLILKEKTTGLNNESREMEHHIIHENNRYYYKNKKDGIPQEIDMGNEKRLERLLLQFGLPKFNGKMIESKTSEDFKRELNKLKKQKGTSLLIEIMKTPEHVFPVIVENEKVYILDNGGLFHPSLLDYKRVIDNMENVKYLKITSLNTLDFGLKDGGEKVKINLNTIGGNQFCCRHQTVVIKDKLEELKDSLKKEKSLYTAFTDYLNSFNKDGVLRMRANSQRGRKGEESHLKPKGE